MKNFFASSFGCFSWLWSMPVRYHIVFIATMANTLEYALRDNMSISMVAMTGMSRPNTSTLIASSTLNETLHNKTSHEYVFDWSPRTQGMILGSFYYGYIVSHLFGGQVCAWLGPRVSVAISILFSCLFTLVIPFAAFHGPIYLAVIRAALGTSQGLLTPSLYGLFSKWIPSSERSTSLACLVVGGNLGSLITMLASGYLCEHGFAGGWPSVYYVHAFVAAFCLVIWICSVRNTPEEHQKISEAELKIISDNLGKKEENEDDVKHKIPWSGILLSPAIWSIGIAKFAGKWGFITWETQLPTYLARALHMNMEQNSVVNALRYLSMSISLLVAGYISDRIDKKRLLSKTVSRKIFESIALIGPALITLMIPFAGGNIPLIIIALIISMILYGFCAGGDNPMVVDISPRNAGAIYGFTAGLSSFPGPLAPYFVGYVLELGNGTASAWDYVFYSCSAFYLVGAIFFLIFGTSKEQDLEKTRIFSRSRSSNLSTPKSSAWSSDTEHGLQR